jgi:hypothetical protein
MDGQSSGKSPVAPVVGIGMVELLAVAEDSDCEATGVAVVVTV